MKLARVLLHGPWEGGARRVGWLSAYGDIHRLQFDPAYVEATQRPTLSQVYVGDDEAATRRILGARADERLVASGRLPAFFENLLPEGANRESLAARRGCDPDDQLELLVAAGHDLMGAIEVVPEDDAPDAVLTWHVTQNLEPIEPGTINLPMDDGFSLAGFVTKFSMVPQGRRYAVRRGTEAGQVIAKLPSTRFPDLVANEALCYRLAEAVGVATAGAVEAPIAELDLPEGAVERLGAASYLRVPRFDRVPSEGAATRRVHVEELTQALGVRSRHKYRDMRPAMTALLQLLERRSPLRRTDIEEVFRRWTAFALMGNTDAHTKNWALVYPDGLNPCLSPAYDMVCVAAYFEGTPDHEFAINKTMNRSLLAWNDDAAATLAREAGLLQVNKLRALVRDTAAQARARWPALLEGAPTSVAAEIRRRLEAMA